MIEQNTNVVEEMEKEIEKIREKSNHVESILRKIVNGKAEDKSKIEVLKDLFPEMRGL